MSCSATKFRQGYGRVLTNEDMSLGKLQHMGSRYYCTAKEAIDIYPDQTVQWTGTNWHELI